MFFSEEKKTLAFLFSRQRRLGKGCADEGTGISQRSAGVSVRSAPWAAFAWLV